MIKELNQSSPSLSHRWISLCRKALGWSAFPIGIVAVTLAIQGRPIAEKAATALVMPYAIAWWGSLVLAMKCSIEGNRRLAAWSFGFSVVAYSAGSPIFSRCLVQSLESQVESFHTTANERLDTIVVLGGGTTEAPDGRAQFGQAGDRVGMAVQLYHQGVVKRIVVTGDGLPGLGESSTNDPSRQAKSILVKSGVSESDIEELPGTNTSEEIHALKLRTELWQGMRCGLITSAFHMPRALALAKRNSVSCLPIPVDYRVQSPKFSALDLIPNANSAQQNELAIKEYLGLSLGR